MFLCIYVVLLVLLICCGVVSKGDGYQLLETFVVLAKAICLIAYAFRFRLHHSLFSFSNVGDCKLTVSCYNTYM